MSSPAWVQNTRGRVAHRLASHCGGCGVTAIEYITEANRGAAEVNRTSVYTRYLLAIKRACREPSLFHLDSVIFQQPIMPRNTTNSHCRQQIPPVGQNLVQTPNMWNETGPLPCESDHVAFFQSHVHLRPDASGKAKANMAPSGWPGKAWR
ncbi:uncharacterized protein CC84DRAFT_383300 [Paraphaeosphaeria sporulosa]|uniref:Uncharacterized protein n=1 Tax=Paraphaeosphaeria sporulosa TaxID=1460663 RepID=A0A177BWD7_9PLEO|nr:uncharacterized protein CC84DRAFT_383300 [Paraphaeosphaeria sporulosa]OAF99803.1 hypothetical protein CC84DRAFT_383300 [Paraphaeosphaeria sporulosa]